MGMFDLRAERDRLDLEPNCASCFSLCCIAHGFKASASFAFDKLPGKPCPNLLADFGCGIHRTLRAQGFSGCTAYSCYGAGQKISQGIFRGIDWRQAPETAESMFQALPIVRSLHQLMWFITEGLDRCSPGAEEQQLRELLTATERLAAQSGEMSWGDVDDHCGIGDALLVQVSATIRTAAIRDADLPGADLRGADLRGADLRGADLQGADLCGGDLWGAALCNADLSGADLRWADLMGTDLGGANLAATRMSDAIFLTQSQLELADGDSRTTLTAPLRTPAHWSRAPITSPVPPV